MLNTKVPIIVSCDSRMDRYQTYGLLIPHRQHSVQCPICMQPISLVSHSSGHTFHHSYPLIAAFNKNINIQVNHFCAKCTQLTIIDCHRATMAVRGVKMLAMQHATMSQSCILHDNTMHYTIDWFNVFLIKLCVK